MPTTIAEQQREAARLARENAGRVRIDAVAHQRWHPRVRLLLTLILLLPTIAVALLTASNASQLRTFDHNAGVVAQDASQLGDVTQARTQLVKALIPILAVSSASHLNAISGGLYPDIDISALDQLAGLNVMSTLQQSLASLKSDATLSSTPSLAADMTALEATVPGVEFGTLSYPWVSAVASKSLSDLDALWRSDFAQLQSDVATWKPPGTFGVHVTAVLQDYTAYLTGIEEFEGTMYELTGQGNVPMLDDQGGSATVTATQDVIQSTGEFQIATGDADGMTPLDVLNAGPATVAAWERIEKSPEDQTFRGIVSQAVSTALSGTLTAYFETDPAAARTAVTDGLDYVDDLSSLALASTQDLSTSATSQGSTASHQYFDEIYFLSILAFVSLSGLLIAGNVITRPLKKLEEAARQVRSGDLRLERLPSTGPREIIATTSAFNDMAATLKSVEAKTVALATEELNDPELQVQLPGRTGQALQAAVDQLSSRIREREIQRKLLYEEATHDPLTGLLNRAAVLDCLTNDVTRRQEHGETVAVLFVDMNELRNLNNTYGHEVGDAAIRTTGDTLRRSTGECDAVGRLGGDEFLVVLCAEHSKSASAVAERIREEVAKRSVVANGQPIQLGCAVGVALAACDSETDPKELVRQADEAMYQAKKLARAIRNQLAAAATQGAIEHHRDAPAPGAQDRGASQAAPAPAGMAAAAGPPAPLAPPDAPSMAGQT